jgi:hypothetical protein
MEGEYIVVFKHKESGNTNMVVPPQHVPQQPKFSDLLKKALLLLIKLYLF